MRQLKITKQVTNRETASLDKYLQEKKYYDPRKWIREGELTFKERLTKSFEDLNNINRN